MTNLVGEILNMNLRKDSASAVVEEKAADGNRGVEETKEKVVDNIKMQREPRESQGRDGPRGKLRTADSDGCADSSNDPDGTTLLWRLKVAKGFSQRSGVDFLDTFSPMHSFDMMRTALAASGLKGWNVKVLDFKQEYLNTPLSEETWLELSSGEVVQACKSVEGLRKSAME